MVYRKRGGGESGFANEFDGGEGETWGGSFVIFFCFLLFSISRRKNEKGNFSLIQICK